MRSRWSPSVRLSPLFAVAALSCCAGCGTMNAKMANLQGTNYYKAGNYTAARYEFQRAAIDDPTNADYAHNLAMAMNRQGDAPGAEMTLRRALTSNPSHQPSYHALASIMKDQGRQQEPVALLLGWQSTQPYSPNANVEMAWAQRESGDLTGAEHSLRQALRTQPNHPTALAHLGQLYQDNGRNSDAVAMYQRSLAANYNQPQVHSRLASMRPAWTYRANERVAAGQPVTFAPQTAWAPAYNMPMTAQWPGNGAYSSAGPIPFAQPGVVANGGTLTPIPQFGNADPAHTPSGATAEAPVPQPF